jgi:2-polyprenyl-6-methoxyphenol hydroxylase-like FAD-dependent oxidoreductase
MTSRGKAGKNVRPAESRTRLSKVREKGSKPRGFSDVKRPLDLVVVGGGPAGMMAGLLFARAGCRVQVFEKHKDFFRDFRGDTVHPSTMEILDQLGMLERFLKRPHSKIRRADLRLAGKSWQIADFSRLHTVAPFIAMMPQWEFLDFLREEAKAYPGFNLAMSAPVASFIEEEGRVTGVSLDDGTEVRARLTIAADGRRSIARISLPVDALAAPIDVLWFHVAKQRSQEEEGLRFMIGGGAIIVLQDRETYWQCAFVIPKGGAEKLTAGGIEQVRKRLAVAAPDLGLSDLKEVADLKLLSVQLDRMTSWSKPGLLAIGDSAHAMSPIGGVGINLAIQDAVAAANVLAASLAAGRDVDSMLDQVRHRRLFPTRFIQGAQRLIQDRIIWPILRQGDKMDQPPTIARLFDRFPVLRSIPGRLMGLGVRRERVRSPEARLRP